ncbi:hypothetical protein CTI14_67365, partial [Methylobacterium radiotolerans]
MLLGGVLRSSLCWSRSSSSKKASRHASKLEKPWSIRLRLRPRGDPRSAASAPRRRLAVELVLVPLLLLE